MSIDVHAHILPEACIAELARLSEQVSPKLLRQGDGSFDMVIDGKLVQRPMPAACWDLAQRLGDMESGQVGTQVLCSIIHTFFYDVPPALGADCARLQNETLSAVIAAHPTRFHGLATLPMQAPELAAAELRHAHATGLQGAQIGSNINGRNLDDPALDPVWGAAEALGSFILVHPCGDVVPGDRLRSYYMRNYVGLPFETTIAGAALVFGGVLERFPGLKICLSHGGGFLPYQAGRFRRAWDVRPEPRERLRGAPDESLARLYYDSIVHAPDALEFLVRVASPGHVLLGSDYPFDMGNPDCVAKVETSGLSTDQKTMVLTGAAEAIFRSA